ncbi:MAG: hypothetical protein JXR96_16015 [Deltaproteobacteria bacterium]|nr:hypothetical protein [Deltaproteobacteria bacterium]
MLKVIGGAAIVGAFFGAMAVEIANRYWPDLIKNIEKKARDTTRTFLDAFWDGYGDASSGEREKEATRRDQGDLPS